jgi:2-oxoglutarate ferredoxin oxidoreductase subunit gamma
MKQILMAGFGGQGILFAGKFLAYTGMIQGMEVSWLPSYGPEMRGGTAHCGIVISSGQIGSPIVSKPDILICMNLPSLDKFEPAAAERGMLFIDSSLIGRKAARSDVAAYYIPATQLAYDNEMHGLANMIMVGKVIRETGICGQDIVAEAMKKTVPERKKALFDKNLEAINLGFNYKGE